MAGGAGSGFASHPELINRKGRPKKKASLTDILLRLSKRRDQPDDEKPEKRISRKERLARELYKLAFQGDLPAIKYIYDRIDGRPTEFVEVKDDRVEVIPPEDVEDN